jgi:hypothetical protein
MRKTLFCLLVLAAILTACVQVRVAQKGADDPVVSFTFVTSTPNADATLLLYTETPTSTPRLTDRPMPTRTATSTPTSTNAPISPPTSAPTDTPSPTPCLPDATFVTDVTIPDDTAILAGETFQKVWRVRSSGCASWPDDTLWVFVSGDRMGAPLTVAVPDTLAGGTADIAVPMVAPDAPGTYRGSWRMQLPDGTNFGDQVYVQIVVPEPTLPPSSRATQVSTPKPPTPGPPPP